LLAALHRHFFSTIFSTYLRFARLLSAEQHEPSVKPSAMAITIAIPPSAMSRGAATKCAHNRR